MKVDKSIKRGLLPFILLLIALATTFASGNMARVALFCISVVLFVPTLKLADKNAVLILLFSIIYTFFSYINGLVSSLFSAIYIIMPGVLFYLFGVYIGKTLYGKRELLLWLFLLVIVAFASYIYRNLFTNIQAIGALVNSERVMESSNHNMIASATMIGLYTSLGLVGLPVFLYEKQWSFRRICFLAVFVLSILSVVFLVNRTGLVAAIVVLAVSIWFNMRKKKANNIRLLLRIIIVFTIGYFVLESSWSGIVSAYADRNTDLSSGGDRFDRWKMGIRYLFSSPLGWSSKTSFAHNMWLDVSRDAGIIPFILLVIITIRYIKSLIRYCNTSSDTTLNTLFVSIFSCFMCVCFVEPVIEGEILYLCLFLMSFGVLNGLNNSINNSLYVRNRK